MNDMTLVQEMLRSGVAHVHGLRAEGREHSEWCLTVLVTKCSRVCVLFFFAGVRVCLHEHVVAFW